MNYPNKRWWVLALTGFCLCLTSLYSVADSASNLEPVVTGVQWSHSSVEQKRSFLVGVAQVFMFERAAQGLIYPQKN